MPKKPANTFRAVDRKVLRWSKLAKTLAEAKADGKTVVFTNGCFDILHVGHIRYLQEARALGDLLVVGVNSDGSIRRLKGAERPIIGEFDRVEVLAALECVDYITIFTEDTPIDLILTLKPDIHAKGGDYKPEDLPEADAVVSAGGRVQVIPFSVTASEGRSTSFLVDRITKL